MRKRGLRMGFISALVVTSFVVLMFPRMASAELVLQERSVAGKPAVHAVAKPKAHPLKVVIDPGHGFDDTGAVRRGVMEKTLTLEIAKDLRRVLEAQGVKVVMTRTDDTTDPELQTRVDMTNTAKPDAFVSIHINSMPNEEDPANGVETYYRTPQSQMLAHTVHAYLARETGASDRGVHTADFWVLTCDSPSILCEVGFISNTDERKKLVQPVYQRKIAVAIADGLFCYFVKTGKLSTVPALHPAAPVKKPQPVPPVKPQPAAPVKPQPVPPVKPQPAAPVKSQSLAPDVKAPAERQSTMLEEYRRTAPAEQDW